MIPLRYSQMNGKRAITRFIFFPENALRHCSRLKSEKKSVCCSVVICLRSPVTLLCRQAQLWPSVTLAELQSECVEVLIMGL